MTQPGPLPGNYLGQSQNQQLGPCGQLSYQLRAGEAIQIQSPNYPSPFLGQTQCNWIIQSPPGTRIKVNFVDLMLYTKSNMCTLSFLLFSPPQLQDADRMNNIHRGAEFKVCGPYSGSVVYGGDQLNLKLVGDHPAGNAPIPNGLDKQRFALVLTVTNEPSTVTQNGQMIVFPAPLRPARPMRNKLAPKSQGPMSAGKPALNHVGNHVGPNTNHIQSASNVPHQGPHRGQHGNYYIPESSSTLPDYGDHYYDENLGSVQSGKSGNIGTFVFIAIIFIILIIVAIVFVRKELKKSPQNEPIEEKKLPEKA